MPESCDCDQCQRARRLVEFAEESGFEIAPWQRHVMLGLAKCSKDAIASSWLEQAFRQATKRRAQTPPWARAVVTGQNVSRKVGQ